MQASPLTNSRTFSSLPTETPSVSIPQSLFCISLPTFRIQQLRESQLLLSQIESILQVVVRITLLQGLEIQQVWPGWEGTWKVAKTRKTLKEEK